MTVSALSHHAIFPFNTLFDDTYRFLATVAASTQMLAEVLTVLLAAIAALKNYLATVLKVLLAMIAAMHMHLAMLLSVLLVPGVVTGMLHVHLRKHLSGRTAVMETRLATE